MSGLWGGIANVAGALLIVYGVATLAISAAAWAHRSYQHWRDDRAIRHLDDWIRR